MTLTATPTLAEIDSELVEARAALAAAEAVEQAAFSRVSSSREAFALGTLVRKALLVTQRSLADAQEATETAKAKVRAIDRMIGAERERQAIVARRADIDRSAARRVAGVALAERIAADLASISNDLQWLAGEWARHDAGGAGMSPATTANRNRAWSAATGGVHSLCTWFPVQRPTPAPATTIPINQDKEI